MRMYLHTYIRFYVFAYDSGCNASTLFVVVSDDVMKVYILATSWLLDVIIPVHVHKHVCMYLHTYLHVCMYLHTYLDVCMYLLAYIATCM